MLFLGRVVDGALSAVEQLYAGRPESAVHSRLQLCQQLFGDGAFRPLAVYWVGFGQMTVVTGNAVAAAFAIDIGAGTFAFFFHSYCLPKVDLKRLHLHGLFKA